VCVRRSASDVAKCDHNIFTSVDVTLSCDKLRLWKSCIPSTVAG
jgi:hypothetical protein